MKMKVLGLSVIALALFAITGRSVAHPVQGAAVQRTVIANYPINPQSPVLTGQTVIANYPINGVSAYPMAAPTMATYAPTHYQAVQVPIQAPLPVPMPAQVPVQVQYLQQQASTQVIPAPVSYAVAQPVPTPTVSRPIAPSLPVQALRPSDCICATSRTGAKVNVFNTAARWQAAPTTQVGGGKTTVDVRGFHQGYWRVSYRNKSGGLKYGWVREQDLVCKETRLRVGY
ncbi:hypothetical protein N9M21_04470 [Alphaproteobacteria bacterium]|nr:hypothetical protein [Alphaproteobacteria bacterium]